MHAAQSGDFAGLVDVGGGRKMYLECRGIGKAHLQWLDNIKVESSRSRLRTPASRVSGTEVPPNSSTGTGALTATYDTASKKKGSYSGLTGPATAAHFHTGEPGKNGGVALAPAFRITLHSVALVRPAAGITMASAKVASRAMHAHHVGDLR
jgi:hypothetical protein